MLIDFTKMKDLIPPDGSVTFTIKHTKDNQIAILYVCKHKVHELKNTYKKEVENEKKELESASKELNKVISFKGSPEELNTYFEEGIVKTYTVEKSLAETINNRIDSLNEKIRELDTKKTTGKTTISKKESVKTETTTTTGLFDTISNTDTNATTATHETTENKENEEQEVEKI